MNEPLASIMSAELVTIHPEDTLADVKKLFKTRRIHHLPVVINKNELVGLITTYDLFKREIPPASFENIKVKEVMTTHLATLEPHEKIGAAAELFLENLFHAVPIVTGKRLVGLVTSFDVLRYQFKKEYPKHFEVNKT